MSAIERAYVALLHGDGQQFFLYALLLGSRLRSLDPDCARILLVARIGSKRGSSASEMNISCLERYWDVQDVEMVDVPIADKSRAKRHRYVFTKLRAFQVACRKVVFLDLDVIVLRDLSDLFMVEAPAGMYHGRWNRALARHGAELPSEAFWNYQGCINAGLLRIDPEPTDSGRKTQVTNMLMAASDLQEDDRSYLPEQYFLVRTLKTWRHIDVRWNYEVCPRYYVDDGGRVVSLESQLHMDWIHLGRDQASLRRNVRMFHFSGTWLEPWWFLHLRSREGHDFVRRELEHRDPTGLVALAVEQWLAGMEEMRSSGVFSAEELSNVEEQVSRLAVHAANWWRLNEVCSVCRKYIYFGSVLGKCEECEVCLRAPSRRQRRGEEKKS